MFLFLWNFILWASYINKIFLFMIACFKRKRGKKNVVSNVIPFARSRWCLCVGLQVNFKLWRYYFLPDCLREISVSSSSGVIPGYITPDVKCVFNTSVGVELCPWELYFYVFLCICVTWICIQVQIRVACLKHVVLLWDGTVVWLNDLIFPGFPLLPLLEDGYSALASLRPSAATTLQSWWRAGQSPDDSSQLLQHLWIHPHYCRN